MKVIFIKNYKTWKKGDSKDIADGFAINYLIPNEIAIQATNENLNKLAHEKKIADENQALIDIDVQKMIEVLESNTVCIHRKRAANRTIQGSVTKSDIGEAIYSKTGVEINYKDIQAGTFKFFGIYSVLLKIGGGKSASIPILIEEDK